jgi:hypothetical protein
MIYTEDARKNLEKEIVNTEDDYIYYTCKEIDKRIHYTAKIGFTSIRFFQ